MSDKPKILVIDDQEQYAKIIATQMPELEIIEPEKGQMRIPDGPAALNYLAKGTAHIDVVLLDVNFNVPDERLLPLGTGVSPKRTKRFQGVAILRELRLLAPSLPVVMLTSVEDLSLVDADGQLASESMTYFLDGDNLDALKIRIHSALKEAQQTYEDAQILWGMDPAMQNLKRRLKVLSHGRMPVILEGETGTGKSFLAEKYVYQLCCRTGPFVVLDLASVPRDLVPAHLFGSVKGAYTGAIADRKGVFEMAHRGVLFIDEIQNIPLEAQKQLLLVLQDNRVRAVGATREVEVDVKVIAATSSKLEQAVRDGRFRADLYMRLSPATRVVIPPLRTRPGDLLFLAHRFASRAVDDPDVDRLRSRVTQSLGLDNQAQIGLVIGRRREGRDADLQLQLPEPSWKQMLDHPWPGNIRELDTAMRNLVTFTLVAAVDAIESGLKISSNKLQIDAGLVAELLAGSKGMSTGESAGDDSDGLCIQLDCHDTLNAVANSVERQYFKHLFEQTQGDFAAIANILLGDTSKGRAVRLRFNQLGLKVKELSKR